MKDIFDIFPVKRTRKKQNKICELPHFPINMLSLLWHLPKSNIIKFSLLDFWKSSCNMNIKLIDSHHIEPYSEYVGVNYFSIIAWIFFRIFLQYMWADVLLNVTEKNISSDDEVCTVNQNSVHPNLYTSQRESTRNNYSLTSLEIVIDGSIWCT